MQPEIEHDHPEAIDLHHHMQASDDGMPEPAHGLTKLREELHDHPTDLGAQAVAEGHQEKGLEVLSTQQIWEQQASFRKRATFAGWDLYAHMARSKLRSEKGFGLKLNDWSLNDWMVALVGEIGEAANILKKMKRITSGHGNTNRKGETLAELQVKLAGELSDAFEYLCLFAQAGGIDLPVAVEQKFEEISIALNYVDIFAKPGSATAPKAGDEVSGD